MGVEGIEPSTSVLSGLRSTTELYAQIFCKYNQKPLECRAFLDSNTFSFAPFRYAKTQKGVGDLCRDLRAYRQTLIILHSFMRRRNRLLRNIAFRNFLKRKLHDQLPLAVPCYDLLPVTEPELDQLEIHNLKICEL